MANKQLSCCPVAQVLVDSAPAAEVSNRQSQRCQVFQDRVTVINIPDSELPFSSNLLWNSLYDRGISWSFSNIQGKSCCNLSQLFCNSTLYNL